MPRAVGIDGVAQALFVPHLLEQAGGHAAAQNGGEHLERKAVRVPVGQAGEGQGQVVLLDGLLPYRDGGGVRDRPGRLPLSAGKAPQPLLQPGHHFVGKAARQGHHHVPRQIVGRPIVPEPRTRHPLQGGLSAQNGAAQRGAPVHRGHEPLGSQIVGGVLVHADLLQDDPPLGLHVALVELGAEHHVAQHVQGAVQMGV
ncbi:hypothetical protein SDC9_175148 [bioreactor metagenome]|uniref:Uncharacterized protein n=1 Tax=bioreactor metagenome TaxID=1076179 RepID=A0A645GUK8_9ZZZZ